jgi:DNA-binding transcriptional ArsR family regulator
MKSQSKSPLPRATYERNAGIYKLLANSKRLEILNLLSVREQAVEQLVKTLKVPKANVSQHLALLRHARLVVMRREGQSVYYRLVDPQIVAPCRIFHKLWEEKTFSY